jgi:hypothetical protein
VKLTRTDRDMVAEHVAKLRELAQTHRDFAAQRSDGSDCRQTVAGAQAAADKAGRLARLIETLAEGAA